MKQVKPAPSPPPAARRTEWTAPTGRALTYGTRFKVQGKKGWFKFLCYTLPIGGEPYVEAKDSRLKIRCIHPEQVYNVSNRKGGPE